MLVLPRLHRELLSLPAGLELPPGAQFIWPGLPEKPENTFCPATPYPWSPAQAAACVADFENIARDGAKGRPVHAMAQAMIQPQAQHDVLGVGYDLSSEERRALQQWRQAEGNFALSEKSQPGCESAEYERQTAAQRVLLLAWLREKQSLELRTLEAKVNAGRSRLAGLLSEAQDLASAEFAASFELSESSESPDLLGAPIDPGSSLPAWRDVLEAIMVFLGTENEAETRLVVVDQAMGEAISALTAVSASHKGWSEVALPLDQLLGRNTDESTPRHGAAWTFLVPTIWAAK